MLIPDMDLNVTSNSLNRASKYCSNHMSLSWFELSLSSLFWTHPSEHAVLAGMRVQRTDLESFERE